MELGKQNCSIIQFRRENVTQIINILINSSNIQFRKENVTLKFKKLNHFELVSNYDYYKNKNDLLSTLIRERERERGGEVVCDTGKAFVPSNSSFASVQKFNTDLYLR